MDWWKQVKEHGDTLNGELFRQTQQGLIKDISKLKELVSINKLADIMPRFKSEIRDEIYALPSLDVVTRMSMYEMKELSSKIESIRNEMKKYSLSGYNKRLNGNAS